MTLKKGSKIKIYQKPLTQEDCEGEAILIKKFSENRIENTEIWEVEFYDGLRTSRKIKIK